MEAVDSINTTYGQDIINLNGGFNVSFQPLGDVKSLTEYGSQKFNKQMGVLNTEMGSAFKSALSDLGFDQNVLANLQADFDATYGVNEVEQLVKAQKYQTMYQASVMVIQAENNMIGSLLNIFS